MAWTPPARPEWVRLVNAGAVEPIADEARRPFDRNLLLDEARARAGVAGRDPADFGADDFVEPLDLLLASLEDETTLSVLGRWLARNCVLRLLQVRLRITAHLRVDPGLTTEEVVAPVIVTGSPRSGTTILHSLMTQDSRLRAPLGWELLWPAPPPEPDTHATDPRIDLAETELRMLARVVSQMDSIHVYGATRPKECISAMSFAFRSEEFVARYRVPSYAEWLRSADMTPAYEAHRLVLQFLQRHMPDRRWVLKSPVHLHSIPVAVATYPDAVFAITHRDPATMLASTTSLVANLRWVHHDHVDIAEVARQQTDDFAAALDALATLDASGFPAPVHHSQYASFVTDPLGTVAGIGAALGLDFDDPTLDAMRAHLATRPPDAHGAHEYSFEAVGLDRTAVETRFARYRTHFDVPAEEVP